MGWDKAANMSVLGSGVDQTKKKHIEDDLPTGKPNNSPLAAETGKPAKVKGKQRCCVQNTTKDHRWRRRSANRRADGNVPRKFANPDSCVLPGTAVQTEMTADQHAMLKSEPGCQHCVAT